MGNKSFLMGLVVGGMCALVVLGLWRSVMLRLPPALCQEQQLFALHHQKEQQRVASSRGEVSSCGCGAKATTNTTTTTTSSSSSSSSSPRTNNSTQTEERKQAAAAEEEGEEEEEARVGVESSVAMNPGRVRAQMITPSVTGAGGWADRRPVYRCDDASLQTPLEAVYRQHLERLLSLPEEKRRYLVTLPNNGGWGNKLRHILGSLKLALATDRILLIDLPFLPVYWESPVHPWLKTDVDPQTLGKMRKGLLNPDCTEALAAAIKDGQVNERFPEKTILLEGGSTAEECMERCRKYILRMEELQVPIRRSDMGIQGTQFMLQRPTPLLRQLVGAMLDEMDFQPRQGRLRVTLHVRTLHRPGAEAAKKWDNEYFRKHMDCARRKIGEEQARLGVSPNNTVVFMATDKRSLLDTVAQELRSVTHRVVLPPAEGPAEKFFDSRNALADDARIRQFMTEWVIFGEGDYALGTAGSSFSMFATLRLGRFMVAMPSDFNPDLCDPLVVITKKSYFDVHY